MGSHLTHQQLRMEEFHRLPEDDRWGATVTFAGTVRRTNNGRTVSAIHYEAEERLAEAALGRIHEAMLRTAGGPCVLIHRLGRVDLGEVSVLITASSEHRDLAFRAVRDAIEAVKATVPIWKKEIYEDGTSEWLDGKPLVPDPRPMKGEAA